SVPLDDASVSVAPSVVPAVVSPPPEELSLPLEAPELSELSDPVSALSVVTLVVLDPLVVSPVVSPVTTVVAVPVVLSVSVPTVLVSDPLAPESSDPSSLQPASRQANPANEE